MKWLSLLILLFGIADQVSAEDAWKYQSFRFVEAIKGDPLPSKLQLGKKMYFALMKPGASTHPLWGIEQVYVSRDFKQKVIVKRDVLVDQSWLIGGWTRVGRGHVLHLHRQTKITAFYAEGFNNLERNYLERQMRQFYKTASLFDIVVGQALAGELADGVGASRSSFVEASPQLDVTPTPLGDSLTACIAKQAYQHAKSAVKSAYGSAKATAAEIRDDPMGAAKAAASYLSDLGGSAWEAGKSGVSYAAGAARSGASYATSGSQDPAKIYDDVSRAIEKTRETSAAISAHVSASIKEFHSWPISVRTMVLCRVAGELAAAGVLSAAAALTGVGTSVAALRAARLLRSTIETVKKLTPIIQLTLATKGLSGPEKYQMLKEVIAGKISEEEAQNTLAKKGSSSPSARVSMRQNFSDIQTSDAAPVSDTLKNQSPESLKKILGDENYAAQIAQQDSDTVKATRRNSAILLSRAEAGDRKAGEVVSREALATEASYLGHSVEPLKKVYRLDQRTPDEVRGAGGFRPNPNKEPGTLWEHTRKGHPGTGNYVSTSVEQANNSTLLNSDFWDGSRMRKGTDPAKVKVYYKSPQTLDDLEFVRYEYRIKDTEGVVLRNAEYADEKEAVIRSADPSQIEFREIRIKQRWVQTEMDGEYHYHLTPVRKIDPDKDITTTDWKSLPE